MIKSKKILVTGAGGFIGFHLTNNLKKNGNYIRTVDVKAPEEWLSINGHTAIYYSDDHVVGDLKDYNVCKSATKDIDIVFNLAADIGGMAYITKYAAPLMYNNALVNLNMLQASSENNVGRFFFSSSACAYPYTLQEDLNSNPLKEGDAIPANPDSFYGWEKLFTERLCEAYEKDTGLSTCIARFHSIYGIGCAYDEERGKAPASISRKVILARNGDKIEIWGDGKQQITFLYIDDCIDGIIKITESRHNKAFNLGTDNMVSIDELADMIIEIGEKKLIKSYNLSKPRGVNSRCADINLAKQELDWEPRISLKEGIRKTYDWVKSDLGK